MIIASFTNTEILALRQIETETVMPLIRKGVSIDAIYESLIQKYMGAVSDRCLVYAAMQAGRVHEDYNRNINQLA